ncbi:MAG: hypothetical protein A2942_03720 [Candidatus Lloydbacteria bacterium RIFCSPLOWO2_01_FULL_50_20]|uniref:Uncharacterized protein n=1 Tax=Candidatus Lloydbacteria bacterium RIFCSPLOWO2_01_FULL_50_20 TaxID=1798665 RepID=A0A1G2DC43_9BACT|nr:MAG: hypothetical protein A3C13_00380 [Candidatus Lloydbacteria bacterium RIFCSPHIGHO2_02_FULL_50_11]OGZ11195.1 MAG: hypothetical protein A2942_03720 [Candidatus Lloydbacteria bacterium RIFCSPLOWO2_01_FULL_50_20]
MIKTPILEFIPRLSCGCFFVSKAYDTMKQGMDIFTKNFFRLALGFICIIAISVMLIIVGSAVYQLNLPSEECLNCAGN